MVEFEEEVMVEKSINLLDANLIIFQITARVANVLLIMYVVKVAT